MISQINPNAHSNIKHNTQRLVGKLDLYLTLKHLALSPYTHLNANDTIYNKLKTKDLNNAVSFFLEKINDDRKCKDIDIPKYLCACIIYKLSDTSNPDIISYIASQGIVAINEKLKKDQSFDLCAKVSLNNIINVQEEITNERSKSYKVTVSIKDHPDYIFLIQAFAGTDIDFTFNRRPNIENEIWPLSRLKDLDVQIYNVVRVDETNNICIKIAGYASAKHGYCVCQHLKD